MGDEVRIPALVRMREGAPGGGKGPLVSENISLTLATGNDQILFQEVEHDRCDPIQAFTVTGNDFSTGYGISPTIRAGADRQNTTPMVVVPVPCQVDGSPVASTLRGFGHGWQGQHNSTNAVAQEARDE